MSLLLIYLILSSPEVGLWGENNPNVMDTHCKQNMYSFYTLMLIVMSMTISSTYFKPIVSIMAYFAKVNYQVIGPRQIRLKYWVDFHCHIKVNIFWTYYMLLSPGECHKTSLMIIQSVLFQVKALCRQTPSHCLNQCCLLSLTPYDVTGPKWSNRFFKISH